MSCDALRPGSLAELYEALAALPPGGRLVGGGTDLAIHLNQAVAHPACLLYTGGVLELAAVCQTEDGGVELGAAATMAALAQSPLLCGPLAAVADAAAGVGSAQIRNCATLGGNLAGASPAGDLLPVLFLLGAGVRVAGPGGAARLRPIDEVVLGPGKTALAHNEAVLGVRLPAPKHAASGFVKLGYRRSVTVARIALCAALTLAENGTVADAVVVAGAISGVPLRLTAAEHALAGRRLDDAAAEEVGRALSELIQQVTPEHFDRDYKTRAAYGVAADLTALLARRAQTQGEEDHG